MYRRLFFLFPDKKTTQKAVNDLVQEKIKIKQMHTLSKAGVDLKGLPAAAPNQQRDMHTKIENILWNSNLVIFFIALFVLISSLISNNFFVAGVSLFIMLSTYAFGYYYLTKPTVHLVDFHAAFEHNEILLMVDVPKYQVAKIERIVCGKNPSALEEGISWTPSDLSFNV
jgi:hypothetical protein